MLVLGLLWDIRPPYPYGGYRWNVTRVSGAEMQTILNNPLASPFTLAPSCRFGSVLAIVLGIAFRGSCSVVYFS